MTGNGECECFKINDIGQLAGKILNYNNFNKNAYNKIIITEKTKIY